MKNLLPFEKKVLSGLPSCADLRLGVAVSGGADSVSLLVSLSSIFASENLRVITVDHGIRPANESGGDATFVKDLCEKLGVSCKIFKIESGLIEKNARDQKKSVEEIARKMRYEAFDSFIKEENLDFLCLAHNQNDQIETVLMRFLQGSGAEGLGGIKKLREKYIRPLLNVSRDEIESYLNQKNQSWRCDSTNFDTKYLRNKVRNLLVPFLNENFSGWQKAVLNGAKKSAFDEDFFKNEVNLLQNDLISSESEKKITIERGKFYKLHPSLARRALISCINKIGFGSRFPFYLTAEILSWKNEKKRELSFENVKIFLENENLTISKNANEEKKFIESGFSFLLEKTGDFAETDDFIVTAQQNQGDGHLLSFKSKTLQTNEFSFSAALPVLVRSYIEGDEIKTSDGKYKSVSKIFSDWKVSENLREKIPVVETMGKNGEIQALLGKILGNKNWIVSGV